MWYAYATRQKQHSGPICSGVLYIPSAVSGEKQDEFNSQGQKGETAILHHLKAYLLVSYFSEQEESVLSGGLYYAQKHVNDSYWLLSHLVWTDLASMIWPK